MLGQLEQQAQLVQMEHRPEFVMPEYQAIQHQYREILQRLEAPLFQQVHNQQPLGGLLPLGLPLIQIHQAQIHFTKRMVFMIHPLETLFGQHHTSAV